MDDNLCECERDKADELVFTVCRWASNMLTDAGFHAKFGPDLGGWTTLEGFVIFPANQIRCNLMLKHLSLSNVGPAPSLDIEFSSRVNLITGDNGLGKSFLLDIAWWALTRTWPHYPARPDSGSEGPTISFTFETERKRGISYSSAFDWQNQDWTNKPGRPASPGMVLYAQSDGSFSVWDPARNYWKKVVAKGVDSPNRPPAYLFNPAQVWDGLGRPDPNDASRTEILCNGLIRDWASWQYKNGNAFKQLCSVLNQLSPSRSELLLPGELTRISLDDVRDMPTLKMPYGKDVLQFVELQRLHICLCGRGKSTHKLANF
jgi:hypothetical protein